MVMKYEAHLNCRNLLCNFHRGALPLVGLRAKDQVHLANRLGDTTKNLSSSLPSLDASSNRDFFEDHLEHRRAVASSRLLLLHSLIFFNQPIRRN